MANTSTLEIAFIDKSIALRTTVGTVVGLWEYHPICNFVSLTGQAHIGYATRDVATNQRKHRYKWDDKLYITIRSVAGEGKEPVQFDLNQVTNQAGWTLDAAGVDQCTADINAWIGQCADPSGGVGVGGALEITQQAVLAELIKDSDFEIKCVRDTNTGVIYIMRVNKDETDGTITIDYIDATGAVVVPPVPGNLVVCDATAALNALLIELQLKADLSETQPVSLATSVKTASYIIDVSVGAGSVAAGARSVSIKNNGAVDVTVDGALLPVGESVGWKAGGQNDTLAAITYTIPVTGSLQILKVI